MSKKVKGNLPKGGLKKDRLFLPRKSGKTGVGRNAMIFFLKKNCFLPPSPPLHFFLWDARSKAYRGMSLYGTELTQVEQNLFPLFRHSEASFPT